MDASGGDIVFGADDDDAAVAFQGGECGAVVVDGADGS